MNRSFILLVLLLNLSINGYASHFYGCDFFYEYQASNIYKVTLVVYGDCSGASFPALNGANASVKVSRNGIYVTDIILNQVGPGVEVTPVCSALLPQTNCKIPNSTTPGVTRYIYSTYYSLPSPTVSNNWIFQFAGVMNNSSAAGRSNSITNVNPGTIVFMEAFLNNTLGPNSSPVFTTLPTPFYCVNNPQQYNQGAVDADNDQLVYSLAPALSNGNPISYMTGYSATNPLSTVAGSFSFNVTTGQMNFTPDMVQRSLVVNKVEEYRNGVLVGTASREMTFVVLGNCSSNPASNIFDTVKQHTLGGVVSSSNILNVCYGTDSLHTGIIPINPQNDTLIASIAGLPSGATATILNNNSTSPLVQINWKTKNIAPGSYNFFLTYKDNGCPFTSNQTVAYTIQIVRPNALHYTVAAPTQCVHKAYIRYDLTYGSIPRTVIISKGGTTVDSFTDRIGTAYDSLAIGDYQVDISSIDLLCPSHYLMSIVDSGQYPNRPKVVSPVYYCKDDAAMPLVAIADSGAILHWWDPVGISFSFPPVPNTSITGSFVFQVNQQYKVCQSLIDSITVVITQRPVASVSGPDALCVKDTAHFVFNGSVGVGPILRYIWNWDNPSYVQGATAGPWDVKWNGSGVKNIVLRVEENFCPSYEFAKKVVVKPMPYAGFAARSPICQYDSVLVFYNTLPYAGQQYTWSFDEADITGGSGSGPYLLHYKTPGEKHLSLLIDLDGCTDQRDLKISVNAAPVPRITNTAGPICIGDKIYLNATGGSRYEWSPTDLLFTDPDGQLYAVVIQPTRFKVIAYSDEGCLDSAFLAFTNIEPCCKFSYPNAFTPNGDGHNDRFRVVTYGNHIEYELSIFNRWGQRVYYGLEAKEGWDGNFHGKPAEAGTYYYWLKAKCFTGHVETQKGNLELIR